MDPYGMEEETKSRSPWVYVGIGCLGVALIWVLTPKILYLEDDRPKAGAAKIEASTEQ